MKKEIMAELEKCYSIAPLMYQGKQHFLVAAEKRIGVFYLTQRERKRQPYGKNREAP